MIKVSIIIPVYNVAPYIEACLQSVFNQTYEDIEAIIVDDCGTDNSMEIVERIVSTYNGKINIKIFHHDQNKGLSAARNTGIRKSAGEYIFFLDSDDLLPNDAIQNLVYQTIIHPNIDFVIGEIKTTGAENRSYPLLSETCLRSNEEILKDYLLFEWNVMACNKLIKKELIITNQLFFKEGLYHEDLDFSFRLALSANSMACSKTVTYLYLIRPNSITTHKGLKNYKDNAWIIRNNLDLLHKREQKISSFFASFYAIEMIYALNLSLILEKNPSINRQDKKLIINELKTILLKYTPNNFNREYISSYIKRILLQIPFNFQIMLFNIYAKIKGIG